MDCAKRPLSFLLLSLFLIAPSALAEVGVYFHAFDPILQGQLEGALAAREKLKFERIVLIPDPGFKGKEPLEARLELLRASVQGDPRFVVPSEAELQRAAKSGDWDALLNRVDPGARRYYSIQDAGNLDLSEQFRLARRIERTRVLLRERTQKIPGFASRLTFTLAEDPAAAPEFAKDPLLKESLLPPGAAQEVRAKHLYGHDGSRGFYGLPASLNHQLDLEQRLNDRIENTQEFESVHSSNLPEAYEPNRRPVFRLYEIEVPESAVQVIRTGSQPTGIQGHSPGTVRFYIHPHSTTLFEKELKLYPVKRELLATPTSSHRSLIAWDPHGEAPAFGVKTTLDAEIGGSLRHLTRGQVERAAAVSSLVNRLDPAELEKRGIRFIDEPLGVYLKDRNLGFALRSLPEVKPGTELIPMFSFYSKPKDAPPPIVESVRSSGLSAREYADRYIVKPLVEQFAYLAFEEGMIGEPHEQNLLIEVNSKTGVPTGVIHYRDLAGFNVNPALRRARGKGMEFLPEGVSGEIFKAERAHPIENSNSYLRQSNFYAMARALRPYFPEVTDTWMAGRFRSRLAEAVGRYGHVTGSSLEELRSSYRSYLRSNRAGCLRGALREER